MQAFKAERHVFHYVENSSSRSRWTLSHGSNVGEGWAKSLICTSSVNRQCYITWKSFEEVESPNSFSWGWTYAVAYCGSRRVSVWPVRRDCCVGGGSHARPTTQCVLWINKEVLLRRWSPELFPVKRYRTKYMMGKAAGPIPERECYNFSNENKCQMSKESINTLL